MQRISVSGSHQLRPLDPSRLDLRWQKLPCAQVSCSKPHKITPKSAIYSLTPAQFINTDERLDLRINLDGYKPLTGLRVLNPVNTKTKFWGGGGAGSIPYIYIHICIYLCMYVSKCVSLAPERLERF
jgi:hypothetical protein